MLVFERASSHSPQELGLGPLSLVEGGRWPSGRKDSGSDPDSSFLPVQATQLRGS